MPLYAGASGKLLLAESPEDVRKRLLSRSSLERFTDETITNAKELRLDLEKIHELGYAVSLGERVAGAASVAAPVRDAKGTMVAAFTISAPRDRYESAAKLLIELTVEGARQVSERMGYHSDGDRTSQR